MSSESDKEDPIDVELVRKLAALLTETGLTEIEVEGGGLRVKVVSRGLNVTDVESIPAISVGHAPQALIGGPREATAPAAAPRGEVVKSPMVGTVYLQSGPGTDPFVSVGALVTAGQTLMIIDAMKTMNPIPAPRAGRVIEILVDDEQPVEFGEPLVVIE